MSTSPFFTFHSGWMPAPDAAADGSVDGEIFAIGDVHGCRDHLERLVDVIAGEMAGSGGRGVTVLCLGDLIDRGPDSLGCMRLLAGLGVRLGCPVHCLRGNHDQYLIDFLGDRPLDSECLALWRRHGADGVLAQLGIPSADLDGGNLETLRRRGRAALGPELSRFLFELHLTVRLGPYLFVHAGLNPARPLAEQEPDEMITIKDPFHGCRDWPFRFAVVHGHAIFRPHIAPHRVAVDSGCYRTGVLTCLQIRGRQARFLCVTDDPRLTQFDDLQSPEMSWVPRELRHLP